MHRTILTFALALGLALGVLPDGPAAAESCLPAGGASLPAHENVPAGDFEVLGRGWGHGVGMSQHGAQGAATLGCSATQILETYYPGARVSTGHSTSGPVVVGLYPDRTRESGGFRADALRVYASEENQDGVPWRSGDTRLPDQRPGSMWWVQVAADGAFEIYDVTDTDERTSGNLVWRGGDQFTPVRAVMGGSRIVQLPAKPTRDDWSQGRPYRHGSLQLRSYASSRDMDVTVVLPDVDTYLRGLAEMPSSWEPAALQAQAITGRSYAVAAMRRTVKDFCKCHLYDGPNDQVYSGYLKESEGNDGSFGRRWVDAVQASAGRVLDHDGSLAIGYYSSTHGGQSETNAFSSFFGGRALPYLKPVDDSRWERHSPSDDNGVLRWAEAFSAQRVGSAFGVGTATEVNVPSPKGAGGRVGHPDRQVPGGNGETYGGVEVVGTGGRVVVSGLEFVQRLGVHRRSELFDVRRGTPDAGSCPPSASQAGNTVVTRADGADRVETAVAVSEAHWDAAADVVLATSITFPDALSAGALAASLDAPLLLTPGSGLADAVHEELRRLGAERVHLLGGAAALSAAVEGSLRTAGYEVRRVAGATRFDTAARAARVAGASPSGDVALALGDDWPDAVSAGALAASADRVPTLLSHGGRVPDVSIEALQALGAQRVVLVGGSAALAGGVAEQLRAAGYEVARRGGATRYETSVAVAEDAAGRGGSDDRPAVLATGQAFPDALAAGALAARLDAGLVLTPRCDLASAGVVRDYLAAGPFGSGVIVGGRAAVSDLVREQATDAISG